MIFLLIITLLFNLINCNNINYNDTIDIEIYSTIELPSTLIPYPIIIEFSNDINYINISKIIIFNGDYVNFTQINNYTYTLSIYPEDPRFKSHILLKEGAGIYIKDDEIIYSEKSDTFFINYKDYISDFIVYKFEEKYKYWYENFYIGNIFRTRYFYFNVKGENGVSIAFSDILGFSDRMYEIVIDTKQVTVYKYENGTCVEGKSSKMTYLTKWYNYYELIDSTGVGGGLGLKNIGYNEYFSFGDEDPINIKYYSFSNMYDEPVEITGMDSTRYDRFDFILNFPTCPTSAPANIIITFSRPLPFFDLSYLRIFNCIVVQYGNDIRNQKISISLVPYNEKPCMIYSTNKIYSIDGTYVVINPSNTIDFYANFLSSYVIYYPRIYGYNLVYPKWGYKYNDIIYSTFTLLSKITTNIGFFNGLSDMDLVYKVVFYENNTDIERCNKTICDTLSSIPSKFIDNIPNKLWVSVDSYSIKSEAKIILGLGTEVDNDILMEAIDKNPFNIHYFSFSTHKEGVSYITQITSHNIPIPEPTETLEPDKPKPINTIIYSSIACVICIVLISLLSIIVYKEKKNNKINNNYEKIV